MVAAARFDGLARPGRRLPVPGFFDPGDGGRLTLFPRLGWFGAHGLRSNLLGASILGASTLGASTLGASILGS